MNQAILNFIDNLTLGDIQIYRNLAILPIMGRSLDLLKYTILDKALEKNFLEIKEVSDSGSVPELFVINKSKKRILLVDGEELKGAKQNRIVNSSIMIKKHSETKIPVSCVEQGRWSYSSANFCSSGYSSSSSIRMSKTRSVSESLRNDGSYRSDQGDVWSRVRDMSNSAKVNSHSSAMLDVFESRKENIEEVISHFPIIYGQKGYFIFLNGELVGFEYFSRVNAFENLFQKLMKSYALDSLLNIKKFNDVDYLKVSKEFLFSVKECKEESYKSVGLGHDFRYQNQKLVASALIVQRLGERLVHFSGHNIAATEYYYR